LLLLLLFLVPSSNRLVYPGERKEEAPLVLPREVPRRRCFGFEVGEEGGGDEVAEAGELPLLLLRWRHLLILLEGKICPRTPLKGGVC